MSRMTNRLLRLIRSLPRRAWLTLRYLGVRAFLFRLVTFPLRLTPLGRRLGLGPARSDPLASARAWYRVHARDVLVVVPTYGPPDLAIQTVDSVRRTTDRRRVRIVVVDDASPPAEQARLREACDAEVVLGEHNAGFAGNVNRGLRRARAG